jgi:hypothetical protein
MKFTPLKFQIPLAAGGIALMAFNYLQFAVPHGKGLVKLSDITWSGLTPAQLGLYLPPDRHHAGLQWHQPRQHGHLVKLSIYPPS